MASASSVAGIWSTIELAGHACDVFEPTRRNASHLDKTHNLIQSGKALAIKLDASLECLVPEQTGQCH